MHGLLHGMQKAGYPPNISTGLIHWSGKRISTLRQQFYHVGKQYNDYTFFIALLLLISSIVIADPSIPLDLSLDLGTENVDKILSREDWREPDPEENEWRQTPTEITPIDLWSTKSIYERDRQLDPIISDVNRPSNIIDSREAAPQFQLRF